MDKKREAYAQEAKKIKEQSERSGVQWWRPSVGKNIIRLLPHWSKDPERTFFKKVQVHFGVGDDKSRAVCRKNLGPNEACPICDYVKELFDSGRKEDAAAGRDMSAKTRYVSNILDVQDAEKGVQVWEMGRGPFNDILLLFLDEEYGDLDDLERGRHLTVMRQGEGKMDTKYTIIPASAKTKVVPKVLEALYNLDDLYVAPSIAEAQALLSGEPVAEEKAEGGASFLSDEEEPPFEKGVTEEVLDVSLPDAFASKTSTGPQPGRADRMKTMREALKK